MTEFQCLPQFNYDHEFLQLMDPSDESYKFTYALIAHYHGRWFHVGSACLIAPNLLVTAKHILEYMYLGVAKLPIDIYDPDIQTSAHGHKFPLPPGMRLQALQFVDRRGDVRRFDVVGTLGVGYKQSDLLILEIRPYPECPHRGEAMDRPPRLDLSPPEKGRIIQAYGYPEHPDYKREACNEYLSENWIYRSTGEVKELNFEKGSAQFVSYRTAARTVSGMSGGPVFTKRDDLYSFCGIVSRGGNHVDYSVISPLWQIATACSDNWPGMPETEGFTFLGELMKNGTIPTKSAELLRIDYDELKVVFAEPLSVREGY